MSSRDAVTRLTSPRASMAAKPPPEPVADNVVHHLEAALLSARGRCSDRFAEHVAKAIAAHLGTAEPRPSTPGMLALWQRELAERLLGENLEGDVAIATVAKACKLSSGHFARAFRESTGMSPGRFRLARRLDAARRLVLETTRSLSDIAAATGFADQSHLARVFKEALGETPSEHRRRAVRAGLARSSA